MSTPRISLAALGIAVLLAACGGTAPSASPTPASPASEPPAVTPTPVPMPSGAGGGIGGDPGGGVVVPVPPGGAVPVPPGGGDGGEPVIVSPFPGAVNVHEVAATGLRASVDGRNVSVLVSWWSGVEPCYVLAGVEVVRDGTTFTISILEGNAGGMDVACIDIAVSKGTVVDLGELEPGSYTIAATGGQVAPIEVLVE